MPFRRPLRRPLWRAVTTAAAMALGLGMAAPAAADLSCETTGWMGAVVNHLDQMTGAPGEVAALSEMMQGKDITGVQREVREQFSSDHGDMVIGVLLDQVLPALRGILPSTSRAARSSRAQAQAVLAAAPCESGTDQAQHKGEAETAPAAPSPDGENWEARSTDGLSEVDQFWISGSLLAWAGFILTIIAGICWLGLTWSINNQRRARRYPCDLDCAFRFGTRNYLGQLMDVSQKGCKMATETPVPPGTRIRMNLGERDLKATVVWAHQGTVGVHFAHPLRRAHLRDLLERTRRLRNERRKTLPSDHQPA